MTMDDFQRDVRNWLVACLGKEIAEDKTERCHRFLEEALELVQALGYSREQVGKMVDYVYNRPVGDPKQEVGGVMVTLAALCTANHISLSRESMFELSRVGRKTLEIREKHFKKEIREKSLDKP